MKLNYPRWSVLRSRFEPVRRHVLLAGDGNDGFRLANQSVQDREPDVRICSHFTRLSVSETGGQLPAGFAADSLQFEGNFAHRHDRTEHLRMLSGRFPASNLQRRSISHNRSGSREHGHAIASFVRLDVR